MGMVMKSLLAKAWWFFASRFYRSRRLDHLLPATELGARQIFLERRFEFRKQSARSCQLGIMQPVDRGTTVFEEQAAVTINESKSGMLLLAGSAPARGKLLEVHADGTGMRSDFSLVEVRWTRPIRETSDGHLYLVGCRMTFGPSSYWSV